MLKTVLQWPGKWNGTTVALRVLEIKQMKNMNTPTKELLMWMKDSIHHPHVLKFYGLTEFESKWFTISSYCSRGPLNNILQDKKYTFNKDLKFSLCLDIANALNYLHNKSIVHGNLKSNVCFVDSKWAVQVADWEHCKIYGRLVKKKTPLLYVVQTADDIGKNIAAFLNFWTAPEIVKSDFSITPATSSDIYSFSIIMQEIFTLKVPYSEHFDTMSYDELLLAVVNNQLRPKHSDATPPNMRYVMENCWSDDYQKRPDFGM